ncbi:hypothetical protein G6F59_017011 [Rhizopus arrhizus]|nr:hypothetical protein G6F59_017011 [Rhizopus arrhizus]
MPAEFTRPDMGPKSSSSRSSASTTCASSETSIRTQPNRSAGAKLRISSSRSWETSATSTHRPASSKPRATASPIPDAPPVTRIASCLISMIQPRRSLV